MGDPMTDQASHDWDRIRILYELKRAGVASFYALDRSHKLPLSTCSKAASIPNTRGEHVIAKALGRPPHQIWPSRYDAKGRRLRPQPAENYKQRAEGRHCQIGEAA